MNVSFGDLEIDGWSVVWAGVVAVVTLLLARYAARATVRLGGRLSGVPHDVIVQVSRAVRYAIYVFGVGVVLSVLGAPIQPVLVALLVVLGGVVLIGRGVADNVRAGLVIQTRRTLKLGDLIESSGFLGHVTEMNSRSVVIDIADGVTVHLPNNDVLNTPLLNYSTRGAHRSKLEVVVTSDVGTDPERSMEAARAAAGAVRGVAPAPAPATALTSVGQHRAAFRLSVPRWALPGWAAVSPLAAEGRRLVEQRETALKRTARDSLACLDGLTVSCRVLQNSLTRSKRRSPADGPGGRIFRSMDGAAHQ